MIHKTDKVTHVALGDGKPVFVGINGTELASPAGLLALNDIASPCIILENANLPYICDGLDNNTVIISFATVDSIDTIIRNLQIIREQLYDSIVSAVQWYNSIQK